MLENKTNNELILPLNKDVVISEGVFFKNSVTYLDYIYSKHYRLRFSTQFKPLAFLGNYVSTFVTTGIYSENDLDHRSWEIKRNLGYCLKVITG
ncbi:MAG: hypothetical protein WCK29_03725 [archaeon]